MNIKSNSVFREILLYLLIIDVLLNYYFLHVYFRLSDIFLDVAVLLITTSVKVFLDYLCIFYLWSNVRVETYSDQYRSVGIWTWTILFIAEYIWNIIAFFSNTISDYSLFVSFILLLCFFFFSRFRHYYSKNIRLEGYVEQFHKDAKTFIALVGLNVFTNFGLVLLRTHFHVQFICLISSSFILTILLLAYCYSCLRGMLHFTVPRKDVLRCLYLYVFLYIVSVFGVSKEFLIMIPTSDQKIVNIIIILLQLLLSFWFYATICRVCNSIPSIKSEYDKNNKENK